MIIQRIYDAALMWNCLVLPSDFSTFFWNPVPLLSERVLLSPMWVVDQAVMVDSEDDGHDPMDIDHDDDFDDSSCGCRFESTKATPHHIDTDNFVSLCDRFQSTLHIDLDDSQDDPRDIDDDDFDSLYRRFESTLHIDVEDDDIDALCKRFETAIHIDDDDFEDDPMDVDDHTIDALCQHKFCSTLCMDSMEDTMEAMDTLCGQFQSALRFDIDDEIDSLCRCFGTMLRLPDCEDDMDSLCCRVHVIDLDDDPMDIDDPMDCDT